MNENVIKVIGKTNTGKTRKILFELVKEEISKDKNLLIVDKNLEYYNHFYDELISKGYNIKVINFNEPLKSNGWDPIQYISYLYKNKKIDKAIEKIKQMGLYLFPQECSGSDPFWSNMAANYFIGAVLSLIKITNETKNDNECTFTSIYNIINDGEILFDDKLLMKKYLENIDSMDPIYIALSPIVLAPRDTRESILSVVKQNLNNLFLRPELLQSFYNNEFKVSDINAKTAIFVINYNPIKFLSNILIEQVYDYTINNNINMTFVLDNFDSLSKIDSLEDMIESANEEKNKLFIGLKNEEKILNLYNKYIFSDIEKVIKLNEKLELSLNSIENELPNLKNEVTKYLNFKEYVINSNNN